jgi:hypothetical protein
MDDDHGLTVEVRQEPGHMLVTVAGEVDIATVTEACQNLAAAWEIRVSGCRQHVPREGSGSS